MKKKTKWDYEVETAEVLNSMKPTARKRFESNVEFQIAKQQGDWEAACRMAYEARDGAAETKTDMRRQVKKKANLKKKLGDLAELLDD